MPHPAPPTLWILEDQLSPDLPTLAAAPSAPVLMVESDRNFRRVPYHRRRIALVCSAMRHFADELRTAGRDVRYYPLAAEGYRDSEAALRHHLDSTAGREVWVVEPSEWHTRAWLETLPARLGLSIRYFPSPLFLTDRIEFAAWSARQRPTPTMEPFYREMRRRHDILMDGDAPAGGTWNLDKLNRLPPPDGLLTPAAPAFPPDAITREVIAEVDRRFPTHPGAAAGFDLPVSRADAARSLADFLDARLPRFGDFQDAMQVGQPSLFHSRLAMLMNLGLLAPLPVLRAAEARYRDGRASLNAVEGFARQILGWREYAYGTYWAHMPEYRDRNARASARPLPAFFWTAETDLNCLHHSLQQVVDGAYGHHIQRLMVISNFATLTGISPQALNDWFLAMYADAHDWVTTPNVIGMGTAADGGTMGTKPYVASAAYIDKMSDYCRGCAHDPKRRTGPGACPFNFLYWTFLHHFAPMYAGNPRLAPMLANAASVDRGEMDQMMRERKAFIELHVPSRSMEARDEERSSGKAAPTPGATD